MKENSIKEDIELLQDETSSLGLFLKCKGSEKYKIALEHILSDYKRVLEMNEVLLKENELLRKYIESWKKYCEEIEEERTEMSNKNCELEFEVEKLQKENEKLKADNYELNNRITDLLENIPIQKIKDIIDRINYDIKKTKEIISNNANIYTSDRKNNYQITRLKAMNTKSLDIKKRLQELLESEE